MQLITWPDVLLCRHYCNCLQPLANADNLHLHVCLAYTFGANSGSRVSLPLTCAVVSALALPGASI